VLAAEIRAVLAAEIMRALADRAAVVAQSHVTGPTS
jgi:hypothetical protein